MGAGWVAGVCINLVGSIMINLGTNVMKMGHNKLAAIPCTSSRPPPAIYKLREWQIGVTMFSLGNVANFISFGYAAQSLLAAIGCVQFVSNVMFASWVLKEQVSRGVLVATAAIVAGCVLLVSGGSHVSEAYTYKELLHLYSRPAYISYLSVGGAAVIMAYAAYWVGSKAVIAKGPEAVPVWTSALPVLYSVFSALIGTQSVLFSKTLAVLLRVTAQGENQLTKWFTWFVLVAFITTAVFWVTRLNKGLRMFPALIIVPSLQICWTLFSILSGMLYFAEYQGMRPGSTAMFVIGVAVVFLGVFLLTRASQPGAAAAGHAAELTPLDSKAHTACIDGDDAATSPSAAATAGPGDERRWQLSAVRSAQSVPSPQELAGMLRGAAQLQPGQQQHPGAAEDDEVSEEEEYERALLACTSGRHHSSSHLGGTLQHQQQRQWSLPAQDISAAAAAAGSEPGSQPEGSRFQRGKEKWLRTASLLKRRVAFDFSFDEKVAAKLTLGLGDSHTPGFSLFTMPMVDIREIPHETSSWRRAEMVDGKAYGRVAETSVGGMPAAQGLSQPNMPAEFDDTGCISHGGGVLASSNHVNPHNIRSSSAMSASFTWPPGMSEPSESANGPPPAAGAFRSINPLANAIDLQTSRSVSQESVPSTAAASSKWKLVQKAVELRTSRSVSQEAVPSAAAAGAKWKMIQEAIQSNMAEFKAMVQPGAAGGSSGGRPYARMTADSSAEAAAGAGVAGDASRLSESSDS